MLNYCRTQTGRVFDSGLGEGSAEIVSYDESVNRAFVVNSEAGTIDVLQMTATGSLPDGSASYTIDVKAAYPGIALGNANSVAAMNGIVAVAIENANKQENSVVAFYSSSDYQLLNAVEVDALPDMVIFTPDGKQVVVANEGEPSSNYRVDPEGSISVIDIDRRHQVRSPVEHTIRFTDFNVGGSRHNELPDTVRIFGPDATAAQDLEPEYVTVSENSRKAWVSLQENNAIAIIDLKKKTINKIVSLGFKQHDLEGNGLDGSDKDDQINI